MMTTTDGRGTDLLRIGKGFLHSGGNGQLPIAPVEREAAHAIKKSHKKNKPLSFKRSTHASYTSGSENECVLFLTPPLRNTGHAPHVLCRRLHWHAP